MWQHQCSQPLVFLFLFMFLLHVWRKLDVPIVPQCLRAIFGDDRVIPDGIC